MRLIRLLPLVVLFAFGAFVTGQAQPAQATLNTLLVSTQTAGVGQQVTVVGSLLNLPLNTTITLTATNGFFTSGSAPGGATIVGFGTPTISFVTTAPLGVGNFTGVWVCQTPGTTTFTLTQTPAAVTAPSTLTASLTCSTLATTPPTQATSVATTVNGTCTTGRQILTATGTGAFTTAPRSISQHECAYLPSTAACSKPGTLHG